MFTTLRDMSENNAPCASKAQLQKILNEADAVRNPLQGLEGLSTFTFEHADISGSAETKVLVKADVTYRQDLSKRLQKGCMALFQQNMSEHYKKSKWGLDLPAKLEELKHKKARFLILTREENNVSLSKPDESEILSFAHFRFEFDDDEQPSYPVLYVYELQVKNEYQRHGFGRKMMNIMELIAMKSSMAYVMLTVFLHNDLAMNFYLQKMKYSISDHSPSKFNANDEEDEAADYEILWKSVSKKANKKFLNI